MFENWTMPKSYTVAVYYLDKKTDSYRNLIDQFGFMVDEIKVIEPPTPKDKSILLGGYRVSKTESFFTRILPSDEVENLFIGNNEFTNPRKISTIVYYFSPDYNTLACLFFKNFTPPENEIPLFLDDLLELI